MSDEREGWSDTEIPDDLQAQIDERYERAEELKDGVVGDLYEAARAAQLKGWAHIAELYRDAAKLAARGEGVEMQRVIHKANVLVNEAVGRS